MWHTNYGQRTLDGAEARLFAEALWDADYEDEDLYIDKPPEEAQRLKDFMRIRDDYFTEVPEDLKPNEIETRLSELKSLCQSICKKSEVKRD